MQVKDLYFTQISINIPTHLILTVHKLVSMWSPDLGYPGQRKCVLTTVLILETQPLPTGIGITKGWKLLCRNLLKN